MLSRHAKRGGRIVVILVEQIGRKTEGPVPGTDPVAPSG